MEGKADAVLIRALEPVQGEQYILERTSSHSLRRITSGPGKLTRSLGIDRSLNGDTLFGSKVWIEDQGLIIPKSSVLASPRIGIDYAGEDADLPWRFTIKGNAWVSKM